MPGGRPWIRYCVNKEAAYGAVMGHLFGGAFLLWIFRSVYGAGVDFGYQGCLTTMPNPDKPEKFLHYLQVSSTIKKNHGGYVHVTYG